MKWRKVWTGEVFVAVPDPDTGDDMYDVRTEVEVDLDDESGPCVKVCDVWRHRADGSAPTDADRVPVSTLTCDQIGQVMADAHSDGRDKAWREVDEARERAEWDDRMSDRRDAYDACPWMDYDIP
jgi:hypothetical protein